MAALHFHMRRQTWQALAGVAVDAGAPDVTN
jgi:hypothetical protein